MTTKKQQAQTAKIERCGFCGMFYIGDKYMTVDELNATDPTLLDNAPLGYCPNACNEDPANQHRRVTRDMAIDAGDLSLEGQLL